jgi:ParB-like chromosome segregation protein Spo0J
MPIDALIDQLEAAIASDASDQSTRVARYNRLTKLAAKHTGLPHPVLSPQLVPVDTVRANDYNPNKVAPPEMRLLHLSIAKDGLTMPVVVTPADNDEHVVVDGFHRTTIVKTKADVRESTAGYLPVVALDKSIEDRITATVRHNMARGSHQVELTAKLVTALRKHNWSNTRIGKELGMDPDEVLRLKQITGLAEAFSHQSFSKAWDVDHAHD